MTTCETLSPLAQPAQPDRLTTPSGRDVSCYHWAEADGVTHGLFTARPPLDFASAEPDLLWLCETMARGMAPGAQVVIALADQPVPFGQSAPEATQFFEAFEVTESGCDWRLY